MLPQNNIKNNFINPNFIGNQGNQNNNLMNLPNQNFINPNINMNNSFLINNNNNNLNVNLFIYYSKKLNYFGLILPIYLLNCFLLEIIIIF
jgi:hypothetical protein